jgi:hypothetical protein
LAVARTPRPISIATRWSFRSLLLLALAASAACDNPLDYCEFGASRTLIFVDRTTRFDDRDREIFAEGLVKIVKRLGTGEEVVLQTIQDDYSASRREFGSCYPGCLPGTLLDEVFGRCNEVIARDDRDKFEAELNERGKALLTNTDEFARSDILRTMGNVTPNFQPRNGVNGPLHVYIFSDLLENSRELPWPGILQRRPEEVVRGLRSAALLPRLEQANVTVFGFGRLHDKQRTTLTDDQRRRLISAWEAIFRASGAEHIVISQRFPAR